MIAQYYRRVMGVIYTVEGYNSVSEWAVPIWLWRFNLGDLDINEQNLVAGEDLEIATVSK